MCRLAEPGDRRYRAAVGEESWEVASVVVAKGHFYGGRFVCDPDARLHVRLFPRPGRWSAVRCIWGVTTGRLTRLSDYRIVPAERVVATGLNGEPVQGDGDVIARLPVDIALSPWTLPVIGPGGPGIG